MSNETEVNSCNESKPDLLKVEVCNGKYVVTQKESGRLYILRNGKEWQDCTVDNLILALAQEVKSLAQEVKSLRKIIDNFKVASCSCLIKSIDPDCHAAMCQYRVLALLNESLKK